ncbi:hypothetical protein AAHC03_013031 [Spirometra sp. Aus1]
MIGVLFPGPRMYSHPVDLFPQAHGESALYQIHHPPSPFMYNWPITLNAFLPAPDSRSFCCFYAYPPYATIVLLVYFSLPPSGPPTPVFSVRIFFVKRRDEKS